MKYKFIHLIEKTKHNELYLVQNTEQEINAVVKISNIGNKESYILKILKHENIVELYDSFIKEGKKYLILEYIQGGELYSFIDDMNEELIDKYFLQLLEGLKYIHSQGVAHRDIKPENIIYDGISIMKYIDFGLSCQVGQYKLQCGKACGTPHYMSPELLDSESSKPILLNLFAVDIWALGIVFMTMIIKQFPWSIANQKESKHYALFIEKDFSKNYWKRINPKYMDTINIMLEPCPHKRGNIQEVIDIFKQININDK